ncbi:hypothetical protein R6Q59_036661 [Mikania micrantha]
MSDSQPPPAEEPNRSLSTIPLEAGILNGKKTLQIRAHFVVVIAIAASVYSQELRFMMRSTDMIMRILFTCLRSNTPNINIDDYVKMQHLHYILTSILPTVINISEEQTLELLVEADAQGVPVSSIKTSNCYSTSIFDLLTKVFLYFCILFGPATIAQHQFLIFIGAAQNATTSYVLIVVRKYGRTLFTNKQNLAVVLHMTFGTCTRGVHEPTLQIAQIGH